ncbi:nucleoside phosphorylase [Mesonia aestuariivivens]|uniref:Nucleoside phosphorylase n=1 Tax=Mesonia aestuariivivens TaxID=2796128 RepID=A0ABS6W0Z3_9FLAO|nr:nucleoside phosphorylase [Mesonia aestuariivivens]MBW2960779.1 nucleoside phosphorylase [Mesonia aestuariivivens]
MPIKESELVLNEDGSIYHLHLFPHQIADTIITVGDPDRVDKVTQYFDEIEVKVSKREFHTQTGTYQGKRLTVISTGIGTDNIDIVFNELDALANIDLQTREVNTNLKKLNFIRIGTSGAIQKDIPINTILATQTAIGFDSLLHFYKSETIQETKIASEVAQQLVQASFKSRPYVINGSKKLLKYFSSFEEIKTGMTATNVGFYAPQGRVLRADLQDENFIQKLSDFKYKKQKITNLEMETSGIYGMSKLLGHRAISLNAILANRITGEFSKNPGVIVERLIKFTLDKIKDL